MATPIRNLNALLNGVGEFSFADGATTEAQAGTPGYGFRDFGNVTVITPEYSEQMLEHYGGYDGSRQKDLSVITQQDFGYLIKSDEWNYENVRLLLAGSTGSDVTQTIQSAAPGDAWDFTVSPSGTEKWYDVRAGGVQIRQLTALTIATLTENTDFVVDYESGRVRFLVNQTASRTPVVTAPAITAGADASMKGITPMNDPRRTGIGRVIIKDRKDSNKVVYRHTFGCELSTESIDEINGQGWAGFGIRATVTTPRGQIQMRDANVN